MCALPIITINRQYASGGRDIGRMLAERLEIPFYDRELIELAAKESGFSEEAFQKVDEKPVNSFLYSLVMHNYTQAPGASALNDLPLNDKLFLIQSNIIKEAADKGPFVVVGRCADYVLRDYENVLHVFIHADKPYRIARAVDIYGENPQKAPDILTKHDRQRASYYNFYTNNKWDAFTNYHLTVNSSACGIEGSVEILTAAAKNFAHK